MKTFTLENNYLKITLSNFGSLALLNTPKATEKC